MPGTLNFFDTYTLIAIEEQVAPRIGFFKDRYFPTVPADIFASDKVLTEFRAGSRKMAPFVEKRAGDIPVSRRTFEIHEYQPPYIAPSRLLTLDDLRARGFGEAIYANSTPAQRAAALLRDDLTDLDAMISNREEWMCAQTMINNGCTMQAFIDAETQGETYYVGFYDGQTSDHLYAVPSAYKWDSGIGDLRGDIIAMCRMLSSRGLPATDLLLGSDAADVVLKDAALRKMMETTSNIAIGSINEQLTKYEGVAFMGQLNFGGFRLNVFSVDETVEDDSGNIARLFPATSAMVTAPGCGHLMYGQVTQIDYGSTEFSTHTGKRIPKLCVDQLNDERKLRLACRPLAAPKRRSPYIYAANVCG